MDPIATIATPQELVLWSRLGPYDRAELDRLLWKEKKLFEWQAFIYPIEDLPLLRAQMRRPWGPLKRHQWAKQFMRDESSLRNYVIRELEKRGPLPSRELEHRSTRYRGHERRAVAIDRLDRQPQRHADAGVPIRPRRGCHHSA